MIVLRLACGVCLNAMMMPPFSGLVKPLVPFWG